MTLSMRIGEIIISPFDGEYLASWLGIRILADLEDCPFSYKATFPSSKDILISSLYVSVITLKEVPNTSTCNFPISTIKG